MKIWERKKLEYRPNIGYTPKILTKVESEVGVNELPISLTSRRANSYLGSDALDSVLSSLSKCNELLIRINKELSFDERYQEYRKLIDSGDEADAVEARKLYEENMKDIEGKPAFDVLPILENLSGEMEQYLDFLNETFFDGSVDYEDTATTRLEEEQMLETLMELDMAKEVYDKDKLNTRIQMLSTSQNRSNWFADTISKSEGYLNSMTREHFHDDIEGAVSHLASVPETQLQKVQTIMHLNFDSYATNSVEMTHQMERIGGREVRETLDTHMAQYQKEMHDYQDSLRAFGNPQEEDDPGIGQMKLMIQNALNGMNYGFERQIIENISNSVQNNRQIEQLFTQFNSKKQNQDTFKLVGTMANEFDYRDTDKEVARFVDVQNL